VIEIPILEYRHRLIVSLQMELTDTMVSALQESVLHRIEVSRPRGLVLDISSLAMVDSYVARVFLETAQMAKIMNVETVIVGMKPEIALTLVQMGFSMDRTLTAVDLESGLEKLDALADVAR
jgi:rsbT antagonist protein RsbS